MKLPGVVIVVIGAACAALVNYFSVGGAGAEWLYAPIAVSALGIIAKAVAVQTPPTVEPSAAVSRGEMVEVQPDNKMQRFLWG
jgi:hypothetical protein